MNGSGIYKDSPRQRRFTEGGGLQGEIGEIRRDMRGMTALPALSVDKFAAPIAASDTALLAATATVTADVVLKATSLTTATLTSMSKAARYVKFTVAGTAADAPASVTVVGTSAAGQHYSETVTLPQTAGSVTTLNAFTAIGSITFPPADGTGATVAIGITADLGLGKTMSLESGSTVIFKELTDGSTSTGTFVSGQPTYGSVTGSADLSTGGTLATETLVVKVDGGAEQTVTFSSPADTAAVVSQINAAVAPDVASASGNNLKLTTPTAGSKGSIEVMSSSTALGKLGLSAGVHTGLDALGGKYTPSAAPNGAHNYAVYYEFDASI